MASNSNWGRRQDNNRPYKKVELGDQQIILNGKKVYVRPWTGKKYTLVKGLPKCEDCRGVYSWASFDVHACQKRQEKQKTEGLGKWI